MTEAIHFEEHSKFRHVVRARAPPELCERVKEAARSEGVAISEFVRRALESRIRCNSMDQSGGT
jgi:predicted HicB family RNase H-like nuclease